MTDEFTERTQPKANSFAVLATSRRVSASFGFAEAKARRLSKLKAMQGYLKEAETALLDNDIYGWRQAMEHLMNVVGSEVESYGGVVPNWKSR